MGKLKVLGINGSQHTDGIGSRLLAEALLGAEAAGAEIDSLNLVDYIKTMPPADYGKEVPEELSELVDRMLSADAILFSTPTHWFNVSSLVKALLDYLAPLESPDFPLEGKVAGLIATCDEDGAQQALSLFHAALSHYGFLIPPYGMVFHNNKASAQSEGGWQEKDFKLLGKNVVELAKSVSTCNWGY